MGTSLYAQFQADQPPESLYARYQREQQAQALFADDGRAGLPVPITPGPVSAALQNRLARGRPRTGLEDLAHKVSGAVAEPALEGLVQAAPALMGTVHAIPDVLTAEGQYLRGQPDSAVAASLGAGKDVREAATQHYGEQPLFGVGPSTNQISLKLRGVLGQPETPAERMAGNISMLATPLLAEGAATRLAGRAAMPTADGLASPLTSDAPLPVELPTADAPKAGPNLARHSAMGEMLKAAAAKQAEPVPSLVPKEIQTDAPPMVGPAEDLTPLRRRFLAEQAAMQPIPEDTPSKLPRGAPRVLGNAADAKVEYKRNPKSYSDDELQRRYTQVYVDAMENAATAEGGPRSSNRNAMKFAGIQSSNGQRYLANLRDEVARRGIDPEGLEEDAPLSARAQRMMARSTPVDEERAAIQGEDQGPPLSPHRGPLSPDVPFDPQSGKGALPILAGLTGAGVGATVGAKNDPDHPVRGALVGGLTGALGGAALGHGAESMGERGITTVGEAPREPAPVVEGPLRRPDANTVGRMIDLTPDEQQRVSSVLRQFGGPGRVSHAQVTEQAAKILQTDPASLGRIDPTRMTGAETLAAAMRVSDNEAKISQLSEHYLTSNPTEQARLGDRIKGLQDEQSALLKQISAGGTAMGRDLNSRKILARMSNNPVSWMLRAQSIAERPLTDFERAKIASYFKADTPPEGLGERGALGTPSRVTPKNQASIGTPAQQAKIADLAQQQRRAEMLRYIGTLRPTTAAQKAVTIWKAGLLTAVRTIKAPTLGRASLAATEEAARPISVGLDALMSHFTGQRTKSLWTRQMAEQSARGAAQGLKAIPATMRGLPVLKALEDGQIPHETYMGNPVLTAVVNAPFRAHEAANLPFFYQALGGSLAEQAGLLEKAGFGKAADLLAHPTPEMSARAVQDALIRTNRNKTPIGEMLSAVQQKGGIAGQIIAPFSTVPGAIATTLAESTPYGLIKGSNLLRRAIVELRKAGVPNPEALAKSYDLQKAGSETIARGALGSAIMLAGGMLWKKGLASGTVPKQDAAQRGENQLEGKPNDAFLLKGNWYQPNRDGSWGMLLSLGAAIAQASEHSPGTLSAIGTGAAAGARIVTDQPFLQGITNVKDALDDESGNRAANYFRQLGASTVPAILAEGARATDPTMRDAQTFPDMVKARIPGQSQTLPAKPNQLGQPTQRLRSDYGNVFSPVESTPDLRPPDPLLAELDRVGVDLTGTRQIPSRESRGDWRSRATATGQYLDRRLRAIIADPRYQVLDDPTKKEVLEREVQRVHGASTRQQSERLGPPTR